MLAFGAACVMGSFLLGIETAGEVQPVSSIQAGGLQANVLPEVTPGDVDGSGVVDLQDVIIILEVVQGYREPTPLVLKADPNGDSHLRVEDALQVLRTLAIR